MDREKFFAQFTRTAGDSKDVAVEREFHTMQGGKVVPIAPRLMLSFTASGVPSKVVGPELSACVIEGRTESCSLERFSQVLVAHEAMWKRLERQCSFTRLSYEVGPSDMPLDVYPDPRYREIVASKSEKWLRAAVRSIGTHVHVGMPDLEAALWVYNYAIQYLDELCKMGDHSNGERLRLYLEVCPDMYPKQIESLDALYVLANEKGFLTDLRRWWWLIRITKHLTIEFRMFGATDDRDEIEEWVEFCHGICMEALGMLELETAGSEMFMLY